ncbi:MAG: tetratricopeptide repeat protein [Nitrospiraceae bacterium]|nr:tetratricopeptide repeat protein [Nitrospiraceae bacterium]
MKELQASDYLNHAKNLLRKKMYKRALELLEEGLEVAPENPFLLSYCGALTAIVAKDFKRGIRMSEAALKQLLATVPMHVEVHLPIFYLNIGRAYFASGDRNKAIAVFRKGLKYDSFNSDILEEMDAMGVRRTPPIPSLNRSHPLNKYIGYLLHKLGK